MMPPEAGLQIQGKAIQFRKTLSQKDAARMRARDVLTK